MPPVVAAAAIAGAASVGSGVIGSRAQSGANKRALAATDAASKRAEAFEREQDATNRADSARRDAEDQRRWDVEQGNIAKQQAERDARQRYEDQIRYRKMVTIARLTGQPTPEPLPNFAGAGDYAPSAPTPRMNAAPLMSRPATATAAVQEPFDPFAQPGERMPISRLSRRL